MRTPVEIILDRHDSELEPESKSEAT
jgi:hypothetical protein